MARRWRGFYDVDVGAGQAIGRCNVTPLDEDREFVRACLLSSPGAWEAFVRRYARLFSHVVGSTCSRQRLQAAGLEPEDLVADILCEILRNDAAVLRAYAGRSPLAAYLVVVARRLVLRRLRRPRPAVLADVRAEASEAAPGEAAGRREEIEGLIATLDESEARLVRLHHIEQRSYGEISRLTGLPLGSIGPALSKAREKMRRAGV